MSLLFALASKREQEAHGLVVDAIFRVVEQQVTIAEQQRVASESIRIGGEHRAHRASGGAIAVFDERLPGKTFGERNHETDESDLLSGTIGRLAKATSGNHPWRAMASAEAQV